VCEETVEVKSEAIYLKTWRGSVGSRRVRLPDFMTVGK
jgi:hypothetical protein